MKIHGSDSATSSEDFGLTKREYFAARALEGALSSRALCATMNAVAEQQGCSIEPVMAEFAVSQADALIDALNASDGESPGESPEVS